jgi:hypothetical protein
MQHAGLDLVAELDPRGVGKVQGELVRGGAAGEVRIRVPTVSAS